MSTLIVTDLDGSLWGTDVECHPATKAALAELDRQHIPVLVATGRRESSTRFGLDRNGLSFPSVLLNGSLGVHMSTRERFHERGFTPTQAAEVIEILSAAGISPVAYVATGKVRHDGSPTTSARHVRTTRIDLLHGLPDENDLVVGFSMLGLEHDALAHGVAALEASDVAETVFYQDHLYQGWSLMVQPAGISKQVGIDAYIDHARLLPDRVIAIGDGGNDLEMLAAADVAVGCAGGDERALALADVVVPHPDEGGWAQVLNLL